MYPYSGCRHAILLPSPFFSCAYYVIPPPVSPVNFWLIRPSRRSPPPLCPLPPACVGGLSSCTKTARSPATHCTVPVKAVSALSCLPSCLPVHRPSSSWLLHQPPPARPHANVSASVCCPRPPSSCSFRLHEPRKSRAILVVPTTLLLLDRSMPYTFLTHSICIMTVNCCIYCMPFVYLRN